MLPANHKVLVEINAWERPQYSVWSILRARSVKLKAKSPTRSVDSAFVDHDKLYCFIVQVLRAG